MMQKIKLAGVMEKFYGRKLTELKLESGENFTQDKLDYAGEYDAYGPDKKTYTDADWADARKELEAAGEKITDEDIVTTVNNRRKATARSKAMQVAADNAGIVKPLMQDDVELQIASIVKPLLAKGIAPDVARARAIALLDSF
jgi:hypothetical protein